MPLFTNSQLIKGIVEQDQTVLNYLYDSLFHKVKRLIVKFGGDYDTANDIFQEAIILFYRKAKNGEFKDPIMVESYIVGVCRFLWQNHFAKESRRNVNNKQAIYETLNDDSIVNEYLESKRKELFYEHFNKLQEDCRNILSAFFRGENYGVIAKNYGFSSEEFARRKKYLCKEYLVKSIKSDPRFKKLIGDTDEDFFETD
jgi:RNA polymerase sigma factor (sigma-70 family)